MTAGCYLVGHFLSETLLKQGKLRHDSTGQPQNIFNSNGDGTYDFYLEAFDAAGNICKPLLGREEHQSPESSAMILFGLGLLGLAGISRRKK
ncbi:PEP-CTERM sorting domain-containing protein [Desulfobacula sp.]|uniref:PEP-CTERM sorting domain-containing protein n=1 Tax=Desulfobacula sp. TaxID=2593537 RepID=UPI0026193312|nr:PEP-CTERM sorting domain-containing protein [Desulfobacula sp.]